MNDFSPWLTAIFASKVFLYIAYAMSVGGFAATLMIQRYTPQYQPFPRYTLWGVLLGLAFSSMDFLLQVGSFSESGLTGMWDTTYMEILWQSGVGTSYKLRLVGWLGLLLLLVTLRFNATLAKSISLVALAASLLIAVSFSCVGHSAEQAIWVRLALTLHIFIAMWWIGFLYPLRHWCQEFPTNTLQILMHEFGKQASVFVLVLLLAGAGISYVLVGSVETLFSSTHGNILLLKLIGVAGILALAARHKFHIVPALSSKQSASSLQFSISIEMGIALLTLITTAALSTLVGPSQL